MCAEKLGSGEAERREIEKENEENIGAEKRRGGEERKAK